MGRLRTLRTTNSVHGSVFVKCHCAKVLLFFKNCCECTGWGFNLVQYFQIDASLGVLLSPHLCYLFVQPG